MRSLRRLWWSPLTFSRGLCSLVTLMTTPRRIHFPKVAGRYGLILILAFGLRCSLQNSTAAGFVDLTHPPAVVEVVLADKTLALPLTNADAWSGNGVEVRVEKTGTTASEVSLAAPGVPIKKLHLHWSAAFDAGVLFLGDAWVRAYGDLGWKPLHETGPLPWYFLAAAKSSTDGYGVLTGPAAFCSWRVDADGIDLWADVRNGGGGVELGSRKLVVCTVTSRQGQAGESAFAAARAFCRQMCPHPRTVAAPVYGFNDWNCAYGADTAAAFLKDAAFIASLSPVGANRPYMVIDDGWQSNRQGGRDEGNPWKNTNAKFGSSMSEVARAVTAMNARPGLWYLPLEAWPGCPGPWHLTGRDKVLDPSNPAVLQAISEDVQRFRDWGFQLIKHDFSTFNLTGKWGNQWNEQAPLDGVAFSDRSKTTTEIILNFYRTLRAAAGDGVLLDGCNTVSHLSAGIFDLQRVGDDTSGQEWDRTRRMGVNALAFRGVQNGAFYLVDPDCAGLARPGAISWDKNQQWLDLVARSGAPLFVSWPRQLVGPEQEKALRAALAVAARPQALGEPLDWMQGRTPSRWNLGGSDVTFVW